jgi:sodium/bile acid cotransporter 7
MPLQRFLSWSVKTLRADLFTVLIVAFAIAATLSPARGATASVLESSAGFAIAALFFLHGARLSRHAIWAGLGHWRFHLAALALTFVAFPVFGVLIQATGAGTSAVATGLVYLCLLPSTVQSSIAYTALAKGNVPAAVCSASLSNVIGVFITPILVALLLGSQGANATSAGIQAVATQILVPFVLGNLARPLLAKTVDAQKLLLSWFDRAVILLIVYRAFSAAIVSGVWSTLSGLDFAILVVVVALLLAAAIIAALTTAKVLRFGPADTAALVFCGMQKSLASGAPMASILFPPAAVGAILLPVMLYHQAQLLLGAVLARRFHDAIEPPREPSGAVAP